MSKLDKKIIEDDINKLTKIYCYAIRDIAAEEFTKCAMLVIQWFYQTYTPSQYDRTYNLMNNSYRPYKNISGDALYGGVQISSEWMDEYEQSPSVKFLQTYGGNPSGIADITWRKGYHGMEKRTRPSPYRKLLNYTYKNDALINGIMNKALNACKKEKYNSISFD